MKGIRAVSSIAALLITDALTPSVEYYVKCASEGHVCSLEETKSDHSHAYGTYVDEVDKDGWGKIWIHGDDSQEGWYQAGFLEGALTSTRIYQHYVSWSNYQFGNSPPTNNTIQFLLDQYEYAKDLSQSNSNDEYYNMLGNILTQFEGILAGVNYAAEVNQTLSLVDLLLLEAAGDLYDIIPAVDPEAFELRVGKLSADDFFDAWHKHVSCSALIKVLPDNSDVYAGHTTWTSYQNMLRVYKNYDLGGGLYRSSHSSKPGVIYSKDDFYVLPNHKLVVMETTNGVMNEELYKLVTYESLLTWQRIPMANALTTNGKDWVDTVARYNSGTYANQWMVLDMKLFTPYVGPQDKDFLWIIELAPGVAKSMDVTQQVLVNGGYWPSYNVPYQKSVYVVTGFEKAYETYGDSYSYEKCTRAQIFARNESLVEDFDDMKALLRYNNYVTDPISAGSPTAAISARYELRASNPKTYGGVDSKVTSYSRVVGSLADGMVCKLLEYS
jgi:hypothetical protein